MNEWSVYVQVAAAVDGDPADETAALQNELDELDLDAVVGGPSDGYGAQLTIVAADARAAADRAMEALRVAAETAGLPEGSIVRLEVMTVDELDRDLARPQVPPLISPTEAAEIVGVTRQRVSQFARTHPDWPMPVLRTASGPLYHEAAVRRFSETYDRTPGPKGRDVSARAG